MIYDSDAYQGLGADEFPLVLDAERARGIVAMAAKSVALELIAKLEKYPARRVHMWATLRRMVQRTQCLHEGAPIIPFAQSPLAAALLSLADDRTEREAVSPLGDYLLHFARGKEEPDDLTCRSWTRVVAEFVDERESAYGTALYRAGARARTEKRFGKHPGATHAATNRIDARCVVRCDAGRQHIRMIYGDGAARHPERVVVSAG